MGRLSPNIFFLFDKKLTVSETSMRTFMKTSFIRRQFQPHEPLCLVHPSNHTLPQIADHVAATNLTYACRPGENDLLKFKANISMGKEEGFKWLQPQSRSFSTNCWDFHDITTISKVSRELSWKGKNMQWAAEKASLMPEMRGEQPDWVEMTIGKQYLK